MGIDIPFAPAFQRLPGSKRGGRSTKLLPTTSTCCNKEFNNVPVLHHPAVILSVAGRAVECNVAHVGPGSHKTGPDEGRAREEDADVMRCDRRIGGAGCTDMALLHGASFVPGVGALLAGTAGGHRFTVPCLGRRNSTPLRSRFNSSLSVPGRDCNDGVHDCSDTATQGGTRRCSAARKLWLLTWCLWF